MSGNDLSLPEQVLLLSLDDTTGRMSAPYAHYAISAATLAELMLRRRVTLEPPNVHLVDPGPTGDTLLDLALSRVALQQKPRPLKWWVTGLGSASEPFRDALAGALVRRGILTVGDETVLWVFHRKVLPTADEGPEQELRASLRWALLATGFIDTRLSVVLALLQATGGLGTLVSRSEVKEARGRVDTLCQADPLAAALRDAVRSVIEDEQAAAAAAATVVAVS